MWNGKGCRKMIPPPPQARFCTRAETITILVFFMGEGGGKDSRTNSCCHKNKLFPRCSRFVFFCISPFLTLSKSTRRFVRALSVAFINTKAVPGDPWKPVCYMTLNSNGQFRRRHCLWQRIRDKPKPMKCVWSRWQVRSLCGPILGIYINSSQTHECGN